MKLNVGCINSKEGYINLDINERPGVTDVVGDTRNLDMFDEGTFIEVFSSECLEHVGRHEWMGVLREWYRVLKAGGRVFIRVPHFFNLCNQFVVWTNERRNFQKGDLSDNEVADMQEGLMQHFYSEQTGGLGDYHLMGFTPQILLRGLRRVGFVNVRVLPHMGDLSVEGYKPREG